MDRLLVLTKLADEFLDAVLVEKCLRFLGPLILQFDFDARVQKRQLAQTIRQDIELKLGRDRENLRVRLKSNQRAGVLRLTDDFERVSGYAASERHVVQFAIARNLR